MAMIPLFPLGNALFPDGVLHLRVFEVRYLDMVKRCIADETEFGVVVLLSGNEVRSPESQETLAPVGTLARITHWDSKMPALMALTCVGTSRFQLLSTEQAKYGLWMGEIELILPDPVIDVPASLQGSANALGKLIAQMQHDHVPLSEMPIAPPFRLDECGWVADRWCELLPFAPADKSRMLALDDPLLRLSAVQQILNDRGLVF